MLSISTFGGTSVFIYKIRFVPSYDNVFVSTLTILFYETLLDQFF